VPRSFAFRGEVDPHGQPFALRGDPVGLPPVHQAPPKALVEPDRWCSNVDDIEHQSKVVRRRPRRHCREQGRAKPEPQAARCW